MAGATGVNVKWNAAMTCVDTSGVDDALEHGALGIRDLSV
jgi:hypothetical protein